MEMVSLGRILSREHVVRTDLVLGAPPGLVAVGFFELYHQMDSSGPHGVDLVQHELTSSTCFCSLCLSSPICLIMWSAA